MIMTAALSMVAASLLKLSGTEQRANLSQIHYTRAQNAAESMVEYGFAELKTRWERQTSFPIDSLRNDPLMIPPSAKDFLMDSGVVYDDLHLIGGDVPPGEWLYIDPNEPANFNDPQKGKLVFSRGVEIFEKAVVEDDSLGSREAYCSQTLLVRDAPLFSHAIFYNMDLEFHPGPQMEMQGPVHSNGDIYVQAVNRLRFHSTLNTAGRLINGFKGSNGGITQTGNVEVRNAAGNWVRFYKGSGDKRSTSSYYDTRMGPEWRETATSRWDGNVNSEVHGVPRMNAVGISDYTPDDPSTPANEKENPAYALIEPIVPTDHANFKGETVMEQQFAYKAGLVFKVEKVADAAAPRGVNYTVSAQRFKRTDDLNPKSRPTFSGTSPVTVDLDLAGVEARIGRSLVSVNLYQEDGSGAPIGGFYDRRQLMGLDVIEMDVETLKDLINDPASMGAEILGMGTTVSIRITLWTGMESSTSSYPLMIHRRRGPTR